MNETQMLQFLNGALLRLYGREATIVSYRPVAGGCINNGTKVKFQLNGAEQTIFLKWNQGLDASLFDTEVLGLQQLSKQAIFTVPEVIGQGEYLGIRYLALEYIDSQPPRSDFWQTFGRQLAQLHRVRSTQYGLDRDNFIGRLPQKNTPSTQWINFFIEQRLETQLGLAVYNQHITTDFARKFRFLYAQLPGILADEPPSLLHGDLWSGNFMTDRQGAPAIIDPAIYYGNREIELAFTQLFGGFDRQFYQSYHEAYPLEPGFTERVDIYNLYPLLVHVNLFGQSYLSGIERTLRKYV